MRTVVDDRSRDHEIGQWVCEKVDPLWQDGNVCVAVEKDNTLLAGVMFSDFNGANVHAHLRCDTPYGMTRGFLDRVFRVAFEGIGAKRMTAACASTNRRVQKVLFKMGFVCEAILRDFVPDGHIFIMVMRPDSCRYLENSHG